MLQHRRIEIDGIVVDSTLFPVVLLSFPPSGFSDAAVESALGHLEELLRTRERHVHITDLSAISAMPSARQRRYAGEWTDRTAELQARYSVGGAVVIRSPVVRAMLTAVHWFRQPPAPHTVVPDRAAALRWAIARLEEAGLPPPPIARLHELR